MNLFALLKVPQPRLQRISVTQQLLAEIGDLFRRQENQLLGEDPEIVPFDGQYQPDDGEILEIDEFDDPLGLLEASARPINYPVFQPSDQTVGSLHGIALTLNEQGGARALLQRFDQRRAITNRGFTLLHAQNSFRKWEGVAMTLDNQLTAVLRGDRLQFRSFFAARQLFDLSQYYVEATDQELKTFQKHDRISIPAGINLETLADSWVRRRVALISASGILDQQTPRRLATAAAKFRIDVQVQRVDGNDRIVLPAAKKPLKELLHFLADDMLESALSDAKYLTNSKRRI